MLPEIPLPGGLQGVPAPGTGIWARRHRSPAMKDGVRGWVGAKPQCRGSAGRFHAGFGVGGQGKGRILPQGEAESRKSGRKAERGNRGSKALIPKGPSRGGGGEMRVSSESRPSSAGEGNGGAGKALLSPPERNPGGWIADSMLHPPGMALEMGWDGKGGGRCEGAAEHP